MRIRVERISRINAIVRWSRRGGALPVVITAGALACSGPSTPAPRNGTPACPERTCVAPRGFVDTPGGLLRVHTLGADRAERKLVVLVHDWAHDSTMFREQSAALRTRYRVVSYDLRGHGSSTDKDGSGGSIADHADDLLAVIDASAGEGESVHLVGHGLGGLIAFEVAKRRGTRVRSLTLIASLHIVPTDLKARYRELADAFSADPRSYDEWPGRLLPVWVSGAFLNARPDIVAAFDTILSRHDPGSVVGTLTETIDYELSTSDIAAVDAPALILYGQSDPYPGTNESEAFFGALADVKRLRIPGAGHEPTLENPGAVNAALARHLGGS